MNIREKGKIIQIAPRYKPAIGGVERHIERLSDELVKRDFLVDILTCKHEPNLRTIEKPKRNIRIIRIPHGWDRNPILVSSWIAKNKSFFPEYDIIHIHDTIPLFVYSLPFVLSSRSRRISITFHGYEKDPIPFVFKILRLLARKLVSRAVCIGKFIEREYNIHCEQCVIGAVDSLSVSNTRGKGLVYIGRLEPDTGISQVLDVLKILKYKYDFATNLTICGSGSLESQLKAAASRESMSIEFMGWVDNPDYVINQSFVALAGGFLSILEAMSRGVPVIALANTSLKRSYYQSIIEAGGLISIQSTAEGIAKEINKLYKEQNLLDGIVKHNTDFVSRLSWKSLAEVYLSLWQLQDSLHFKVGMGKRIQKA